MEKISTYQKLSKEAQKRNATRATQYAREYTTRITIKAKKENFIDIENYMNKCIDGGLSRSKNEFLLSAIRYAIENDFKGIE